VRERLRRLVCAVAAAGALAPALVSVRAASDLDEFRVKRESVFAFAQKPTVTRRGDRIEMRFETKGLCDVTVAVEDASGKIIRHLASGVLGPNAPGPFQKGSKSQVLVWDGKNDQDAYVDDKDALVVRVSLGLKPQFERRLFWSPYKRLADYPPLICARPEGVYVFEGRGTDHLRLYDHDGRYVRTVYPFPAAALDRVVGLERQTVVQTGQSLPRKLGYQQATLLTSGNSALVRDSTMFGDGFAATSMAVQGDRIALAFLRLNRLATDGASGGLPLTGPETGFMIPGGTFPYTPLESECGPASAAFSPDGKTLYLTGFMAKFGIYDAGGYCRHGVYRVSYEEDDPPTVFAGRMDPRGHGTDHAHLAAPLSVACDAKGRVYVADYGNSRIQVFDPAGQYLKTIPVPWPAKVQIDPRTQEVYVASWRTLVPLSNALCHERQWTMETFRRIEPTLTRLGPFEDPKVLGRWPLPLPPPGANQFMMGPMYGVELDFYAKEPTLWAVARNRVVSRDEVGAFGVGVIEQVSADERANAGIVLLVREGDAWVARRRFAQEALKEIIRLRPPDLGIQRLYVNEKNHRLYLLEHLSFSKSHHTLVEIDPSTGKERLVQMPFRAEDICFDQQGRIYLRTDREVVCYDAETWREVPWDYGEERTQVTFGGGPAAHAAGALPIPGRRPMWFHEYGMAVSPRGHLAVSCANPDAEPARKDPSIWKGVGQGENVKKYEPRLYPGRARHQEIHVFDEHGRLICEDAVPGLGIFNGIGIDKDDNLYVMPDNTRYLGDAPYPNRQTGTLVKFKARGAQWGDVRVLSSSRNTEKRYVPFVIIPLPEAEFPKRPPDTSGGIRNSALAWMLGAEWFYGGVGITGAGCNCWHSRFCLDTFARSFAAEPDLYSVAVLDSAGNLVTRVGRYGNEDDRGDEVPFFYPAYVAADTDRRLFVSDVGNACIVSVRLGYHEEAVVPLRGAPE
jgi:hypothetical protein